MAWPEKVETRAARAIGPLFAAFVHVASELTFILNSARLRPPRAGHGSRSAGPERADTTRERMVEDLASQIPAAPG